MESANYKHAKGLPIQKNVQRAAGGVLAVQGHGSAATAAVAAS